MGDQAGVLQAQRVARLPLVQPVGQAAGLGASPPVAAAAPDEGAHGALTGVAHAQGPVGEDLDLDGAVAADIGHVLPAHLTAEDHAAHPQLRRRLHPRQGVDGHLGAAVEGQVRHDLPGQGRQAPVLDDDGVHPRPAGLPEQVPGGGQLPVRHQGVHRQVDLHPPEVAVGHGGGELLRGEILRTPPGVEAAAAEVYTVGAALHRRHHGLPVAGGGEELHHFQAVNKVWPDFLTA